MVYQISVEVTYFFEPRYLFPSPFSFRYIVSGFLMNSCQLNCALNKLNYKKTTFNTCIERKFRLRESKHENAVYDHPSHHQSYSPA